MQSHTGAVISLGKGAVLSQSTKQKLSSRSSAEAELIAVENTMGDIMWMKNFLRLQGYALKSDLMQDNTSAMLLEKNGKASSGKHTRYMSIRNFFMTDRICLGDNSVIYCPTDDMVPDILTKPLQGSKFRMYR